MQDAESLYLREPAQRLRPRGWCRLEQAKAWARAWSKVPGFSAGGAKSRPVALLELLVAAAGARIVAANVLQGVAHRLLVGVVAVRAMHMAMVMVVMVVMIVIAVRAMDMGLLGHCGLLR